jgi:hypothetical protein
VTSFLSQFHSFNILVRVNVAYTEDPFPIILSYICLLILRSKRLIHCKGDPSLRSFVCRRVSELYFKTDPNHCYVILLKPTNIITYWPNKALNQEGPASLANSHKLYKLTSSYTIFTLDIHLSHIIPNNCIFWTNKICCIILYFTPPYMFKF